MTKMMARIVLPMANTDTQTITKATIITNVKVILTGLNICWNCFMNPIKNPVPVSETSTPTEYKMTKMANEPVTSSTVPSNEMTKPPIMHAANPIMRCWRVNSIPNVLEKASFSPVSSPPKFLICCVSMLIHREVPVPAKALPLDDALPLVPLPNQDIVTKESV